MGGEFLKTSATARIVSVLAGCAVFVLLMITVGLPEYALVGGVLGWLVVTLIYDRKQRKQAIVYEGTTRSDIDSTIKNGRQLTQGMRRAIQRLTQIEIRQQVEELCRIAESMFDLLKKDPKDIRIVKQFISHYLEPTHKIIVKYAELATIRPMPADAVETLERTENSLKNIRAVFLKQKERMLNNDVLDLDAEIKLFETLASNITGSSSQTGKNASNKNDSGIY